MNPEEAASALLSAAGKTNDEDLPIDVHFLAEEHDGLDVQEHADLTSLPDAPKLSAGAALSGLLLPAERRIWINAVEAQRSVGRRRFTIAHELGHWHLHCHDVDAHARFCRSDEVGGSATEARAAKAIEREANRFAAALLMPKELVCREAQKFNVNLALLARRFDVSGPAMQVRLESLDLLPDYMKR